MIDERYLSLLLYADDIILIAPCPKALQDKMDASGITSVK